MISAGIDLAAEPKGTALALVEFSKHKAKLTLLEQGLDDKALIDKTDNADKVDAALKGEIEAAIAEAKTAVEGGDPEAMKA